MVFWILVPAGIVLSCLILTVGRPMNETKELVKQIAVWLGIVVAR